MDGRELAFDDATFDVVFTLSSIEHFGSRRTCGSRRRDRPGSEAGGHAVVVTECLLRLHPLDTAAAEFGARVLTLGRRMRAATPRRRCRWRDVHPGELMLSIVRPPDCACCSHSTERLGGVVENLTVCAPDGRLLSRTDTSTR